MKHRLHAVGVGVTILALMSSSVSVMAAGYTVRKGDTLWSIAKRNDVKVDDIKRANGVSANKPLKIGLRLTIPSKGEPVTKGAQVSRDKEQVSKAVVARYGQRAGVQMAKAETTAGVTKTALSYRGAPYVHGGTGRSGFDCSGFTRAVYARYGIRLPHQSAAQASCGQSVGRGEMKPGDLVFFQTRGGKRISHVGIYIGENRFVHASTPRRGVIVSSLSESYYAGKFRGARRIVSKE